MLKTYLAPQRSISFPAANLSFYLRYLLKTWSLNQISTVGSIAGLLLSITLQNAVVATLPLALHVLVMSETQRRQISKQQQIFAQVQSGLDELQNKLTIIEPAPATVAPAVAQMPTQFNQILAKLRQMQGQQKVLELKRLAGLEQQLQQQQTQLEKLLSVPAAHQQSEIAQANLAQISLTQINLTQTIKNPLRPKTDRVAIFIDEANLYHAALARGITIDYAKFLALIKDSSTHCQAIAYIATDRSNYRQKGFLNKLKRQGFELVTQEIIRRSDGSVKGNVDLRLGAELLVKRIQDYDTAVLVSGDADFVPVIEQSRNLGKRIEVASFRANTGAALIKASDSYLNLELLLDRIRIDAE
jgi:uncharacterized LabA/DUF88 family protein